MKAVQRVLGYSSPTKTLSVYAHLMADQDDVTRRAVYAAMEGSVSSGCPRRTAQKA